MLPSGLPETVGDDEQIAVFLTSSSHFNATLVKSAAFVPNAKNGEKSVCRHPSEPNTELQRLAAVYLPHISTHGAGVVAVDVVRGPGVELTLAPGEPPDRHANMKGWTWSASDPKMGKAKNIVRAKLLAEKSTLVRW